MAENNYEMMCWLLVLVFAYLNIYFWMNPGQMAVQLRLGWIYVLSTWRVMLL